MRTVNSSNTLYRHVGKMILATALFFSFFISSASASESQAQGSFQLVSVGVGDPDLITVRAIDRIQDSDIIICRPKVKQAFAEYLQDKTFWEGAFEEWRTWDQDCEDIEDRQKREECRGDRKVRQNLETRIRSAVKQGKTVSVLGQGDLLLYGGPYRWYLEELADLEPEIVPGVSCLNAANANLGTELMGGKETSSAVLTHYKDIDKVAEHQPTLVIFTMHTEFSDLVQKLKEYYPRQTPIAVVFYAGYKDKEYRISGTLDTILEKTKGEDFPFEHLVYVGDFMAE
ncbi:MAG: SAM-dependent methyltransferase [Desulfohalobiaceae bacterium]